MDRQPIVVNFLFGFYVFDLTVSKNGIQVSRFYTLMPMTLIDKFCALYSSLDVTTAEALTSIYTQDVEFIDPISHHHGLNAVKTYFAALLENTKDCTFHISMIAPSALNEDIDYTVTWTMHLVLKNKSAPIHLQGISILKVKNEKIYYHRDFYDLGEMVYEHIPVLGWVIHKIKARLHP
ncbi:nuclear transport factor 2 family protein [Alteromonas sp. 14N.309.X.WAT.G.H12]|uniref:nuclear transport factor 2 family protein n=1 Tax=Alteromonas sp. 14N.309.X.WAT.G.H12 TaxID=3120824 RepID=UPI002FD31EA3